VTGLNAAEESYGSAITKGDVKEQIKLQSALKFNGGGQSLRSHAPTYRPRSDRSLVSSLSPLVYKLHDRHPAPHIYSTGHINHSLFWKNLAPAGSTKLSDGGALKQAIEKTFGSVGGTSGFWSYSYSA
jgi:Fe-Mn family superoxide dismutase